MCAERSDPLFPACLCEWPQGTGTPVRNIDDLVQRGVLMTNAAGGCSTSYSRGALNEADHACRFEW